MIIFWGRKTDSANGTLSGIISAILGLFLKIIPPSILVPAPKIGAI
jgi:hypothetical protein